MGVRPWDNGREVVMAVITAVETQKNDSERVSIYLDGKFGFGASQMLALARNLVEGRELSEEDVADLQRDDAVERAYGAALNFLSYRPRSRRELEAYFRQKKTDPDIAAAVLERLERLSLVDDRAFARFWVENRQAFRPRGPRALRAEMRQKGLDSEVIDDALEGLVDEEPIAYEAGLKKAGSLPVADEREFFRKMVGFLQRRGFGYEVSASTARRIYQEKLEAESG
jgi:regulatory protein